MLQPGQGSWATIDSTGSYRHVFADPHTGNVGAIITVTEHGAPAMLDLRLRVMDGEIHEIETLYIRDPGGYRPLRGNGRGRSDLVRDRARRGAPFAR